MGEVVKLQDKQRDVVFEVVAEVCGIDIKDLTRSSRGALNKAVSELKEVNPSEQDIRARAELYKHKYEGMPLTPNALAKHWPLLSLPKESRWSLACRVAREGGLEPFRGAPYETPEQFMKRAGV